MYRYAKSIFSDTWSVFAVTILAFGTIIDTYSTSKLIHTPSLAEANPVIRLVLDNGGGAFGILAIKALAFGALLALIFTVYSDAHQRLATIIGAIVCGTLWIAAGVWNLLLIS